MDIRRLVTDRAQAVDASGIRRIFQLGAQIENPINLSIGQPDFPVPEAIKRAAIEAIENDQNGYTQTQGIAPLREKLTEWLATDLGWSFGNAGDPELLVTSGTSGALFLAFMSLIGPGDEAIIPDPYFVMYPHVATMCGGTAVRCDTYPDFRMTAERVEPLITERTKLVLYNAPSNPAGVVGSVDECRELLDLCRRKGVLLISDEIYDEFTFDDFEDDNAVGDTSIARCPSPARFPGAQDDVLVIRGFGKTYGITGWRMGYAAGPAELMGHIGKFQQYTYVCAPSVAQHGCIAAMDVDMGPTVAQYKQRRDSLVRALSQWTEVAVPGGAFYLFPRVPEGKTGTRFVEEAISNKLLVIPGGIFSDRDTHFRLSFASSPETIERGIEVLERLYSGV
ncbi:MAG: pyridoxal phosphate-dependent aminotransferase [Phycisphaerales bacterium JB060]